MLTAANHRSARTRFDGSPVKTILLWRGAIQQKENLIMERPFYLFRSFSIPERMKASIERYVIGHVEPGDFLCAVIDNDLSSACMRADDENLENLPAYVAYFYNDAPSSCWGSKEKRLAWTVLQTVAANMK